MKSASSGLITLLGSNSQFIMADLYEFALIGGSYLRYAAADRNITLAGVTYVSNDVRIERSKIKGALGLQVDTLEINCYGTVTGNLILGTGLQAALIQGSLDGATLTLKRVFMPTWGDTSLGAIILFAGQVSDITAGRTQIKINVKSWLEQLNRPVPALLYQAPCAHTIYDPGCGVTQASFGVNAMIMYVPSDLGVFQANINRADHYFDQGQVLFTSGVLAGLSWSIKSQVGQMISIMPPLLQAPAAGDGVTLYPGCDYTIATCTARFNNLARYMGQPFIPQANTAI